MKTRLKTETKIRYFVSGLCCFVGSMSISYAQQTDTLFTVEENIAARVKEVTQTEIIYCYPGEDVLYHMNRNTVKKIRFKSGRVQNFAQTVAMKPVKSGLDWQDVSIAVTEAEIMGLQKIDIVSTKAKGTTVYSNVNTVKERAFHKLKMSTALMGGNVVFVTDQSTAGNRYGSQYQAGSTTETFLTGVAYTSTKLNFANVQHKIQQALPYKQEQYLYLGYSAMEIEMKTEQTSQVTNITNSRFNQSPTASIPTAWQKDIVVSNPIEDKGFIYVTADIDKVKTKMFKVIWFDEESIVLYCNEDSKHYNFILSTIVNKE